MKELSIEEKAIAYNKAIERAKEWFNSEEPDSYTCIVESIFPELNEEESEDERIRKELIHYFSDGVEFLNLCSFSREKIITWLEKQGEPADINPSEFDLRLNKLLKQFETIPKEELVCSLGFYLNVVQNDGTYQTPDEIIEECYQDNADYIIDIVTEHEKPTDKVEPKFHEGEWAVSNLDGKSRRISEVHFDEYNSYYVVNGKSVNLEEYDRLHHLWTFADAKDGDVLCYEIENVFRIFIYKNGHIHYHCCYYNGHLITVDSFFVVEKYLLNYIHPATKEQRDLLFQKMKEAGYEFDFERKELKKLEEDLTEFENTLANVCRGWIGEELGWKDYIIKNSLPLLELAKEQFDKYEQKSSEWSEEDEEYFNFLEKLLESLQVESTENEIKKGTNSHSEYYYEVIQWLKALKDRVQQ